MQLLLRLVGGLAILTMSVHAHGDRFFTDREVLKTLTLTEEADSFTFAIFGDRTGGNRAGLKVLKQAVTDVNVLAPDLVMTVGDLVEGYNRRPEWIEQAKEYTTIMNELEMPWYPVAGNHDIYWRGKGRPEDEHEGDYEKHFGPLWYAFEHKDCLFVVLYSDEGHPRTGMRSFRNPEAQQMSGTQKQWLKSVLDGSGDAEHVFVFLHHPRWEGGRYGDDWRQVHQILKDAGSVSAVFAGHTHVMKYGGEVDGIRYYTLGTTGGNHEAYDRARGRWQHFDVVTVREDAFHVAAIAVGEVVDASRRPLTVQELLKNTKWHVHSEATRQLSWSVEIPELAGNPQATLVARIKGGADDSGDRGGYLQVKDPSGKLLKELFSLADGFKELRIPVELGTQVEVLVVDQDTEFKGKHPGNGGEVEVKLELR